MNPRWSMRRGARRWLLLIGLIVAAGPVTAQQAAPTAVPPEQILAQMQAAARELDYAGVYVSRNGDVARAARIVHLVDGTGERERIEMLDGPPVEFLRHNDQTQCLMPDSKLVLRQRPRTDRFPGVFTGDPAQVLRHYEVRESTERARVAGRSCQLVDLVARDTHRYDHRLCIDDQSRLLLRHQLVSAQGRVIDQTGFVDLVVGKDVAAADIESSWDVADWRTLEIVAGAPIDLGQQGWRIAPPPGFKVISQRAQRLAPDHRLSHLMFTDGLALISLFIERVDTQRPAPVGEAGLHRGAMHLMRVRLGDFWLTALGEVPSETLRQMIGQTQYVPPVP